MFDLIEEPLDQVASSVEVRAETDRLLAIAPRRNVGPNASLPCKVSDPVGVIATVSQQHCSCSQARQQFASKPVVMCLTGCQRKLHWKPVGIDDRMNFAGQTAARPTHGLFLVASDGRGVLVNPHNRSVDYLDSRIMRSRQCVNDPAPNTGPTPANEAVVASRVWTERSRQIAPRCARSQDPEDAVEDAAVIHTGHAA